MSVNWAAIIDGTWPAAGYETLGPFRLREGQGGGSRVSAASRIGNEGEDDFPAAEAAMQAMGQKPIFCIWPGDEALDGQLAARGYDVLDPVNIYSCPVDHLTDVPIPSVTVFNIWEPLAIMREIWSQSGVGPERQAVMHRASGPKTGLLLRHDDQPAGAGFAAIQDGTTMVHALEIMPEHRRQGMGRWAMRSAAFWAMDNGAQTLSVICTKANAGANGLYQSLGMEIVGKYHYRQHI